MSKQTIFYYKEQLDDILDQQIIISQLSKGGITYQDTENMDDYERIYIIQKLIQMKKEEIEARQKAIDERRNK